MGIFGKSNSKGKKWGEKKGGYPHEPAKSKVTTTKTAPTAKPVTVETPKKEVQPAPKVEQVKKPVEQAPVVDPNLEFQMMYGLADLAEEIPASAEPKDKAVPTVTDTTAQPEAAKSFVKTVFPKPVTKRLVSKKLTIILVENTATVAKEKEKVLQIVESFAKSDLTCIINYGETVVESEIFEVPNSEAPIISYNEMTGEKACLFDALAQVEKIVSSKYFSTIEREKDRVLIDSISIIGVGTCRDNCSVTSKEEAISCFYKAASKTKVSTKYFCLKDDYFLGAAEVGFHSIGAISRTFQ